LLTHLPPLPRAAAVVLTAAEQEMYKRAHAASAALFQQYRALGSAQINKHLLQIMALLLPMRRVCSGEAALSMAPPCYVPSPSPPSAHDAPAPDGCS
jgi:hypothetical protein